MGSVCRSPPAGHPLRAAGGRARNVPAHVVRRTRRGRLLQGQPCHGRPAAEPPAERAAPASAGTDRGGGERRTLALVARYGDACNLPPSPEIPHKLDVLRRHCDAAGTDFNRIERTSAWNFAIDDGGQQTKELLDKLRWFAELGIDTVIGRVVDVEQRRPLEWLAEHVVPAALELQSTR
jgi:hypothetical protein